MEGTGAEERAIGGTRVSEGFRERGAAASSEIPARRLGVVISLGAGRPNRTPQINVPRRHCGGLPQDRARLEARCPLPRANRVLGPAS